MIAHIVKLSAALAALAIISAAPVGAQTMADFVRAFSGTWQTLDPDFTDGGACRVGLNDVPVGNRFGLTTQNCGGLMAGLRVWGIDDNQLALVDDQGAVVARLGGNQNRVSGQTSNGETVIFERVPEGSNAPASDVVESDCTYFGYTSSCAKEADFARPSAEPDREMTARVLVKLNARAEARPDAEIRASIPAGTCVRVSECTTASDGDWCRATIADTTGWIRQRAMRRDRWPVLTYTAGCELQ
ncbi:MAG: AprI/Inh family metalloprotease inhibitor [Fulvimarina manganoxydans]|uniref:SH3 domain-containing protein n=1 Tax=Fulvimarina manganoxydans TaxID=937218 RepID=UPI002352F762|nr:AprI/Inh family metalloprotease inhibitor [Fulvimarina manganoxydans]MCK5931370.1 AprI/Inh family metalloprotease inhibitor [Fulvimarina manganoxydans]